MTDPARPRDRHRTEPTSYDVARHAGVSQSAVSRCFRPGASISARMRARIEKAAEELGYQPNALAQGLISKRTNLVAVMISNLTNLYYPEVLANLTHLLSENGVRVLLFALDSESDVDLVLDQLWRHRVDGAIVAARLSDDQVRLFSQKRVALVLYNRVSESEPAASICCDSLGGETILVDKLIAAGHRRFAIIAGPQDSFVGQERLAGARVRIANAGLPEPILEYGLFSYESGMSAFRALKARELGFDALVAVNDVMALGAMDCARREFGMAIPDDLSIVGFDGVDPAHWLSYQLTTVRQPVRRMTEAAVTALIERIENPALSAERRFFAGQFIKGGSSRIG